MTHKNVDEIKQISEKAHILLRPTMYIGAVDEDTVEDFFFEDGKIQKKEITFIPGLVKIISEIFDNALDILNKTNCEYGNEINITFKKDHCIVQDTGPGMPVKKNADGIYFPELAWGSLRAGSNFDDDKRENIGANGLGSSLTNIFSKKFIGTTNDGQSNFMITFKNNMDDVSFDVRKSTDKDKRGTTVKFYPDFERFGVSEFSDIYVEIIRQRLINLSITYPDIKFKLNGKLVSVASFKKYVQMFAKDGAVPEIISDTDELKFAIISNHEDDFTQFSYVNGLKIPDGGTHIDYPLGMIIPGIREKLIKKFKTLKPADIKNKLTVVMFMQGVKGLKFNSQIKEKITNSNADISKYFSEIKFENVVTKLLKNKTIIEPITEVYRIKEEFKNRQEMKGLAKAKKKIKSEKYLPPTGNKKYLCLVEGECLADSTNIMVEGFNTNSLREIEVGQLVKQNTETGIIDVPVLAKTHSVRNCIRIDDIIGGPKHKLTVFDVKELYFKYETAEKIAEEPTRYALVKTKINGETRGLLVNSNDTETFEIHCEDNKVKIEYTDDDYIAVRLENGEIVRKHAPLIKENEVILIGCYE